ncbi:hypothetical protein TRVL_05319 [Trypanosoma vivax]|nr:hypothetical protein TRVL_05319 [Trypanosoma vivax]
MHTCRYVLSCPFLSRLASLKPSLHTQPRKRRAKRQFCASSKPSGSSIARPSLHTSLRFRAHCRTLVRLINHQLQRPAAPSLSPSAFLRSPLFRRRQSKHVSCASPCRRTIPSCFVSASRSTLFPVLQRATGQTLQLNSLGVISSGPFPVAFQHMAPVRTLRSFHSVSQPIASRLPSNSVVVAQNTHDTPVCARPGPARRLRIVFSPSAPHVFFPSSSGDASQTRVLSHAPRLLSSFFLRRQLDLPVSPPFSPCLWPLTALADYLQARSNVPSASVSRAFRTLNSHVENACAPVAAAFMVP